MADKKNRFKNPSAEVGYPDSGKLITPDQARGYKEFFCPDSQCKERRLFIKREHDPFFSHYPGFDHEVSPETLLHKLAIQHFKQLSHFEIPDYNGVEHILKIQQVKLIRDKTTCEFNLLKTIIPDVKLVSINGFLFAVEIFVTHDVDEKKKKKIEAFGLPTIRVDLSSFYQKYKEKCRTDQEFILRQIPGLLSNKHLKSWVVPPKYLLTQDVLKWEIKRSYSLAGVALVVVLLTLILHSEK